MNANSLRPIVMLFVMMAANVANVLGFALDVDMWYNVLFSVVAFAAIVVGWWKNQNVTVEAQEAQEYLKLLKEGKEDGKEVEWDDDIEL